MIATIKLVLDWMAAVGALIAGLLWIQSALSRLILKTENEKEC